MKTLKDKVVAITGAGSGIGRSTSVLLAKRGATLAISDVNESGLRETERLCKEAGATVASTKLDVSDRAAVHAWADETHRRFGTVNVIINNAGVALGATVEDMRYEDFEWLMGVNFWGVVYGTKAFLPYLKESGDGHIVNVSSIFGIIAVPAVSAYNASKFAVKGFTEALAEEMEIEGARVGVTCVHPGGIKTNIARGGRMTSNAKWGISDAQRAGDDFAKVARTTPDEAGKEIVDAILGNDRRLLIGADAKAIALLQRLLPTGYQRLLVASAKFRNRAATQ